MTNSLPCQAPLQVFLKKIIGLCCVEMSIKASKAEKGFLLFYLCSPMFYLRLQASLVTLTKSLGEVAAQAEASLAALQVLQELLCFFYFIDIANFQNSMKFWHATLSHMFWMTQIQLVFPNDCNVGLRYRFPYSKRKPGQPTQKIIMII